MEFWGVEVKSGQPLKVKPEYGKLVHISNAALGEVKDAKGAKSVPLRLQVNDKKLNIGTLSAEDRPQMMFDLVFEKEFELSHDWKNGSVYFVGYLADDPSLDDEDFPSDSSEDVPEDELVGAKENGSNKPKSADVEPQGVNKKVKGEDSDSSGEDADDHETASDDEMALGDDSSDTSGDDSDELNESSDEEEMPKVQQSKKRPAETAQQTPIAKKQKAKSVTPTNSGNKKGPNTATPFPSKAAGGGKKSNGQSPPKSAGKNKAQFNNKGKRGGK